MFPLPPPLSVVISSTSSLLLLLRFRSLFASPDGCFFSFVGVFQSSLVVSTKRPNSTRDVLDMRSRHVGGVSASNTSPTRTLSVLHSLIGAVAIFAFLYSRDNAAEQAQLAKLSREESLSNLKLRVNEKKIISVGDLRGIARLVILAGPESFVKRLWQLSPIFATEWSKWLDEQKQLAKVSPDSPVYLSLRLDGRVHGSGVGFPPWNANCHL